MVNQGPARTARTLRAELEDIVRPAARRLSDHPYYRSMRDGSLAPVVFAHLALQDSLFLLPRYGKVYARCAGMATRDGHARFLARMAAICLENSAADTREFTATVGRLGLVVPPTVERPPIAPTTLSYTSFCAAAGATSYPTGVAALVPSAWLQLLTTDDLLARHEPGSRYAALITETHPGDGYRELVREFLDVVDEIGTQCSAAEREAMIRHVDYAARYEWMFVDAAWRLESWPL